MSQQNENNVYLLRMSTLFNDKTMSNRTVDDWVACFLKVRNEAQKALAVVNH
jgi:hypothetical protein